MKVTNLKDIPRLPDNSQRLAVVGKTGTGKTVAGLWHLSNRNLESFPWIIYDFKRDDHIESMERVERVGLDFVPKPKHTGIFVINPHPGDAEPEGPVEEHMWKIWGRGNCGVFIDECYIIGRSNKAYNAILTQGRSLRIPTISCSQRPTLVSRFVFSEAEFVQCFSLNDERDQKTVNYFASIPFTSRLPDYHSHYYDVGWDRVYHFSSVPTEDEILERIYDKLKPKRRFI